MSFSYEKKARRYYMFIGWVVIDLICFAMFISWFHGREVQNALLNQQHVIVSSLINQGVSSETIAIAIKSSEASEEGLVLLQQLGHTRSIPLWLLPVIRTTVVKFGTINIVIVGSLGVILLCVSAYFLSIREQLYRKASMIISQYKDGDFSEHLPRNQTGTLFHLFASIDELATALQAKNDTIYSAKEFLMNTVSDISHQLKTPLAALSMYTEIILSESDNIKTIREFAGKSMQSLERMEQLIQSLLKTMRLDAGSIVFEKNIIMYLN